MNGKLIVDCCDSVYAALTEHTEEIAQLDQQIGDGDHIYNLMRGLEALRAMRAQIAAAELGQALQLVASKLLATVGGSNCRCDRHHRSVGRAARSPRCA